MKQPQRLSVLLSHNCESTPIQNSLSSLRGCPFSHTIALLCLCTCVESTPFWPPPDCCARQSSSYRRRIGRYCYFQDPFDIIMRHQYYCTGSEHACHHVLARSPRGIILVPVLVATHGKQHKTERKSLDSTAFHPQRNITQPAKNKCPQERS